MSDTKYPTFYSFEDAYKEAVKDNLEKTDKYYQKNDMASIRRYFRDFLDSLSIEFSSLKGNIQRPADPDELRTYSPDFLDSSNLEFSSLKENTQLSKAAEGVYALLKRAPYKFNETMLGIVVDFIKNWKSPKYKNMRKGAFSPEFKNDYYAIISAVETNMESLGSSPEQIFQQRCMFWSNIASKSNNTVLSFLHINSLLDLGGDAQFKPDSLTAQEIEDFIFLDKQFVRAQHEFSNLWKRRMEKMFLLRKRNIEECELQLQEIPDFKPDKLLQYVSKHYHSAPDPTGLARKKAEDDRKSYVSLLTNSHHLVQLVHESSFDRKIIDTIPVRSSNALYKQVLFEERSKASKNRKFKKSRIRLYRLT